MGAKIFYGKFSVGCLWNTLKKRYMIEPNGVCEITLAGKANPLENGH
jgi:hypothetical protein